MAFIHQPGTPEFFTQMYNFCAVAILVVHLVHWIINFSIETWQNKGMKERTEGIVGWLLLGFGFAVLFAISFLLGRYGTDGWLSFTQVPVHASYLRWWKFVSWIGVGLAVVDVILFLYVHISLGTSWSGTVNIKEDHELKTKGSYRFCRHPMYAVLCWFPFIAFLLTGNWLLSLGWAAALTYPVSRYKREERLMLKEFGDQYLTYMQKVGPFFPCVCGCGAPKEYLLRENVGLLV